MLVLRASSLLADRLEIHVGARRQLGNCARHAKTVAGAHHCRNPFLALARIGRRSSERPEPPPLGEPKCGIGGFGVGMRHRFGAVRLVHTVDPQLVGKPPFPVAASGERS